MTLGPKYITSSFILTRPRNGSHSNKVAHDASLTTSNELSSNMSTFCARARQIFRMDGHTEWSILTISKEVVAKCELPVEIQ